MLGLILSWFFRISNHQTKIYWMLLKAMMMETMLGFPNQLRFFDGCTNDKGLCLCARTKRCWWKVRSTMQWNLMLGATPIIIHVNKHHSQSYGGSNYPWGAKEGISSILGSNAPMSLLGWPKWCIRHPCIFLKHWPFRVFNQQLCFV
jgi:hypothetical protein